MWAGISTQTHDHDHDHDHDNHHRHYYETPTNTTSTARSSTYNILHNDTIDEEGPLGEIEFATILMTNAYTSDDPLSAWWNEDDGPLADVPDHLTIHEEQYGEAQTFYLFMNEPHEEQQHPQERDPLQEDDPWLARRPESDLREAAERGTPAAEEPEPEAGQTTDTIDRHGPWWFPPETEPSQEGPAWGWSRFDTQAMQIALVDSMFGTTRQADRSTEAAAANAVVQDWTTTHNNLELQMFPSSSNTQPWNTWPIAADPGIWASGH